MTYMPDFTGARAKKERGFQYAKAIMDETSYLLDAPEPQISPLNRIPVRIDYEPETGYHVYRVTAGHSDATIRRWGLMTGDAVHNLRSALDHLVWQLACHKTGGPDLPNVPEREKRIVQFPIVDSPTPAERDDPRTFRKSSSLKRVRPEHRAIIYEHQPFGSRYNFGLYREVHPFTRLQILSNVDKHRTITPIAMLTNRFYLPDVFKDAGGKVIEQRYAIEDEDSHPAQPGAEVLRVRVWPPTIRRTQPSGGYVSPTPSFQDVLSDGTPFVRSVDIELTNIGFQVGAVIDGAAKPTTANRT
jgi:hypothetical protein